MENRMEVPQTLPRKLLGAHFSSGNIYEGAENAELEAMSSPAFTAVLQLRFQEPRRGNSLSVHRGEGVGNGERRGVFTRRNIIQP